MPLQLADASMWGSDPLYWTHLVLLNVHVVRGLLPHGSTWEEVNLERARIKCNHVLPGSHRVVAHAHLVGMLVRKSQNSQCATYTIDDGTALVDCIAWNNNNNDEDEDESAYASVELGTVVRCLGRLEWPPVKFQSSAKAPVRRLVLDRPIVMAAADGSEEIEHWTKAMDLWRAVYTREAAVAPPRLVSQQQQAARAAKYGGELEDAIMKLVRQAHRMPLIGANDEHEIRTRYSAVYATCFQSRCLANAGDEFITERLLMMTTTSAQPPLRRLCRDGQITMLDAKLDLFAIITHEHFLAPAVLAALRLHSASSQAADAADAGAAEAAVFASHEWVVERVRRDPRLHAVSTRRINSTLSRLLDDSAVYEGEPNTFAVLEDEHNNNKRYHHQQEES